MVVYRQGYQNLFRLARGGGVHDSGSTQYNALMSTEEQAKEWVRMHEMDIIQRFAGDEVCLPTEQQITLFMAGSPGAGKTETSKSLIQDVYAPYGIPMVRIDPDEIRNIIPHYRGDNTDEVKGASFLAVEKLYDHVLEHRKNAIIDSTFSRYEKQEKNIARALNKNRMVQLAYVYQDPLLAWEFTKIREKKEGRSVPRDFFIRTLFESRENVQLIKNKFGDAVTVIVFLKDYQNDVQRIFDNVQHIDGTAKINYSVSDLEQKLC